MSRKNNFVDESAPLISRTERPAEGAVAIRIPSRRNPSKLTRFLPDIAQVILSFLEENDEMAQRIFLRLIRSPLYRHPLVIAGMVDPRIDSNEIDLESARLYFNARQALKKIIASHKPDKKLALARYNPFITRLLFSLNFDVRPYFSKPCTVPENKNTADLLMNLHQQQKSWKETSFSFLSLLRDGNLMFSVVSFAAATMLAVELLLGMVRQDCIIIAIVFEAIFAVCGVMLLLTCDPLGDNTAKLKKILSDRAIHIKTGLECAVVLDCTQKPNLFQMPRRQDLTADRRSSRGSIASSATSEDERETAGAASVTSEDERETAGAAYAGPAS